MIDNDSLRKLPFYELLPVLREKKDLSQFDLADILKTSQTTISRYERGENFPSKGRIVQLSEILACDLTLLLDSMKLQKNSKKAPVTAVNPIASFASIPVKGAVSAGTVYDLYPEDNGTLIESLGRSNFQSCFTVVVKGDSMEGRARCIKNGSLAIIDSDFIMDSRIIGKVVCARLDGEEHVLKEFVKHNGKYFLKSWNEQYSLIEVTPNTHVEGVLIGVVQAASIL